METSALSLATRSARPPAWNWLIASLRCLIIFSSTASTWPSSSVIRSSTSRCLMAASARRIVPRRSFSPARIALFMSSVMRSLRVMPMPRMRSAGGAHALARDALHVALDGGRLLTFPLLGRLLVEFPPAQLGENAGLLARAFETPQGGIEVLILTDTDARHRNLRPTGRDKEIFGMTGKTGAQF